MKYNISDYDWSRLDSNSKLIVQALIDNDRGRDKVLEAVGMLGTLAVFDDDDRFMNSMVWASRNLQVEDKIKYAELAGYENPEYDSIQLFNNVLTATRIQRTPITESKLMRDINTGEMINVYDPPYGAQVISDDYVWTAVRDTRSDYTIFVFLEWGQSASDIEREKITWFCYDSLYYEIDLLSPTCSHID